MLQLRFLYALVGLAWGAVIGPLMGVWVGAMGAGISWVFLFGDSPWPEASGWVIVLLAWAAGLGTIAFCVLAGYAYGAKLDKAGQPPSSRLIAYGLGGVAVLFCIGLVVFTYFNWLQDDMERVRSRDQVVNFETLIASRHVISDINATTGGASIGAAGTREGSYKITWLIREQAYRKTLLNGKTVIKLETGLQTVRVAYDLAALKRSYREKVLTHRGASVLVEEDFVFEATVEPILSKEEFSGIPQAELQNLSIGQTRMRDTRSVKFPVRFTIS